MSPAVRMSGIGKAFGPVTAVSDVDLVVEPGSIHAVVGENGAGKTTLMRILYGALRPDRGSLEVGGRVVEFDSPSDAIAVGIGMVSQHYGIIPGLTCLQNLMLGAEPGVLIDRRSAETRASAFAEEMGFGFDWASDAETLSPAACQKLEILKLLWKGARIMILDEPTAMLSPVDAATVFQSLQSLVDKGATVILVTHRLPEVMDHCQRVTVLRGGEKIADLAVSETTDRELARMIVGSDLAERPPRTVTAGPIVLAVQKLSLRGDRGEVALDGVSFEVRAGEIVGIAGVDGSGQRELVRAIAGLASVESGEIEFLGEALGPLSPAQRLNRGIRLLPEDRITEAEIESWSLELNAALGLQRHSSISRQGRVDRDARMRLAASIAERFGTRHGGLRAPISSLSGGNQQRFVAARSLALSPKLIVAFQPARGLDIHGARAVYDGIREACFAGAAALIVSFDLEELLENCDRILTAFGGHLSPPPPGKERDREAIGRLMVGVE